MKRSAPQSFVLLLTLAACPAPVDDDDSSVEPEPIVYVEADVTLTAAATGARLEGATVATGQDEHTTDENGRATIEVPELEPFGITVSADGYADHVLAGLAGDEGFHFQTLVSDRGTTDAVFGALGLAADPEMGILVVGLDTPTLQPAIGASVTIDAASDAAFVFVGGMPQSGSELVAGAASFVTFPNVEPGAVEVVVASPAGQACLNFPAEREDDDLATFEVGADAVTVATWICGEAR
jgi:hypothetical protein